MSSHDSKSRLSLGRSGNEAAHNEETDEPVSEEQGTVIRLLLWGSLLMSGITPLVFVSLIETLE